MANLLRNGDFEMDWGVDKSHRCLIFPVDGEPYETDVGNIFTPSGGWVTWFRHDSGTWDQPEVRDAWMTHDSRRVHSGQKGTLLFTFYRKHDAGFLQQVQTTPGERVRLTAWAHAWSNHKVEGHESCGDDARCSCGVGRKAAFILEGEASDLDGDPWNDAIPNFTFYVGIDPTGGTNPFASTVVWGRGAHIYNQYAQLPSVEETAQADTVTVFLRSKTLWPFKHNDAYWDDAELVVVDGDLKVRLSYQPVSPRVGEAVTIEARSQTALSDARLVIRQPSGAELPQGTAVTGRDGDWYTWTYTTSPLSDVGRYETAFSAAGNVEATGAFTCAPDVHGLPREQYKRTYVLLPPDANAAWALAVVDGAWNRHRYTVGGSADDAGIGDLDARRVVAVNPGKWPSDLRAFFAEHYPGVEYVAIEAADPQDLQRELRAL